MSTLGIVYSVGTIKDALNTPPGDDYLNPECIGLIFSKGLNFTIDLNNLDNYVDLVYRNRKFEIEAVFRDADTGILFSKHVPEVQASFSRYDLIKKSIEPVTPQKAIDGSITPVSKARIATSNYQFLDGRIDFVFFGKPQLEAVMINVDEITISGAEINYGIGTDTLNNQLSGGNVSYPTLKAESKFRINNQTYIPNVIIGLPCPPVWGGSNLYFLSGLNLNLNKDEDEDEHVEFYNMWNRFAQKFLAKLHESHCLPQK